MKTTLMISLLALSAWSHTALAGNNISTATFSATFVVNEACAVQSGAARPVVSCQFNTPYQVSNAAPASSASAEHTQSQSQTAEATVVTITF
jgi:hypothetical protein